MFNNINFNIDSNEHIWKMLRLYWVISASEPYFLATEGSFL